MNDMGKDSWEDLFDDMQLVHELPVLKSTARMPGTRPSTRRSATKFRDRIGEPKVVKPSESFAEKRVHSGAKQADASSLAGDRWQPRPLHGHDTMPRGKKTEDANHNDALARPEFQLSIDSDSLSFHKGPISFNTVILNVSGMRFETHIETLEKFPQTLLGDPARRAPFYNPQVGAYFLDRSRHCFEAIFYFYQSGGRLKRPDIVPMDVFVRELKFYDLGEEVLDRFWYGEGYRKPEDPPLPDNWLQRHVWQVMEHPHTSYPAQAVGCISVAIIVLSTATFCIETMPQYSQRSRTIVVDAVTAAQNMTNSTYNFTSPGPALNINGVPIPGLEESSWDNPFYVIEVICISWFSFELVVRFLSCPSKLEFIKAFLNWVDLAAIIPFFINIAFKDTGGSAMSLSVLRILRLVRVFRIIKLSRHSSGLQILGKTFTASVRELLLLIFFLLISLVLFSSAVYFAETGVEGTQFTSIPASFWYAIVTMTTVGYGDMAPIGATGKCVGALCAISGVLVLALPVPVIVANFKHFYRQETRLATFKRDGSSDDEEDEDDDDDDDEKE